MSVIKTFASDAWTLIGLLTVHVRLTVAQSAHLLLRIVDGQL